MPSFRLDKNVFTRILTYIVSVDFHFAERQMLRPWNSNLDISTHHVSRAIQIKRTNIPSVISSSADSIFGSFWIVSNCDDKITETLTAAVRSVPDYYLVRGGNNNSYLLQKSYGSLHLDKCLGNIIRVTCEIVLR